MVDYVRIQATAARLIAANGVSVTLLKQNATSEYDPASGTVDSILPASFPGFAVRESQATDYQVKEPADTRASATMLGIMLVIQGADIAIGDRITMDGQNWRIYGFTRLAPGPTLIYYKAGLCLI